MNHALQNVTMITASAGTGKTYSLMGAIARAINSGTKPSQILATTFTKKAAAELIVRVQAELFGNERPDAARQMSVSMVGTVNSVCSRLLQEYAVDAGLSPALQVIAEDEQLRIFQLATDAVFAEFTPRIQPLARRLGHDGDAEIRGTDADWRTIVRDITDAARSNRIAPSALTRSAAASWQGLQQVLGPAGVDDRASWSHQLLQGLMSLRERAAEIADGGKTPPKNLLASITLLEPVLTHASPDDAPWRFWIDAAGVSNADAKRQLESYISAVDFGLVSNPAFQTERRQFTELVFCAPHPAWSGSPNSSGSTASSTSPIRKPSSWICWRTTKGSATPSRDVSSSWWSTNSKTRARFSSSCSPSSPSWWTRWSGWATPSRPSMNSGAPTRS